MSDVQVAEKTEGAAAGTGAKCTGAKWPGAEGAGVTPPVTQGVLANAAARAAASQSRRDLAEYLRLRRKSA